MGGGVSVSYGTFTMSGGEIYRNTAEDTTNDAEATIKGGGVFFGGSIFTKTGGTIYGCDDNEKTNILKKNGTQKTDGDNVGIAVYVDSDAPLEYLDKTADDNHDLYFAVGGSSSGWEEQ
jgi:hypothetical protein